MNVKITMDDREDPEFKEYFQEYQVNLEVKRLNVGDFICSKETAIERKTRNDFESSIIDKRLSLQLQNLKENYKNIIIIIEGTESAERISRNALLGAYSSLVTNGIGLFFTRDKNATAEIIYSIAKHEQLAKKTPFSINAKRKTFTISQTQRAILESFPMIGPKLAKSLLEHFGSLESVLNATEEELLKVDKIGNKKAKAFLNTIQKEYISKDDPI